MATAELNGGADRRVGVVIVTHGDAGGAMLAAVQAMLGQEQTAGMEAVSVPPREPKEAIRAKLGAAVERNDAGRGVLLVCDLRGSTPANCCVEIKHALDGAEGAPSRSEQPREVLCGVSLPMLIKLASADRTQLTTAELAHVAAETAIRSIQLGEGGQA
jgi:PTS system mannose-specific IIA component